MRRRYLVLASVSAAACFALRSRGDAPQPTASTATPARDARLGGAAGGGAGRGLVPRAHYRLAFEQQVTMPGRAPTIVRAEGAWIATPRADGRTEVRFAPTRLDGPSSELPRAEDLDAAAQLVTERGVLTAIGFPEQMPRLARKLLTGLATTFQCSAGSGAAWTAAEEDLTGRYDAAYRRSGDELARSRARYTALRAAEGLTAAEGGVSPAERTRFRIDADGVVTATVELDVAFSVGAGVAPVQLALRASLERESIEHVAPPGGDALAAAPVSGHADFAGARRNADESLVAGATVADLLAEVKRVAAIPGPGGGNPRAQALARLAALIRLEPDAAEEIAEHVRQHAEDLAEARVLVGALASARIAEGTDALAGLMAGELPEAARRAVVGALSFASPVTPASLGALAGELDESQGEQAALGLGTHARKVRERDPAAADRAIELLLERQARAGSGAERRLYLEALGNSGAPRALPVLRAAIAAGSVKVAAAAAFSLRFVPGAEVDALLEESIARTDRAAVALAAIRAAAYRDPARWRPLLRAAQERYAGHDGIQGEIRAILQRWS